MKRRQLVSSLLGLSGTPSHAQTQAPRPPGKIGYVHPRTHAPEHATLLVLRAPVERTRLGRRRERVAAFRRGPTAARAAAFGGTGGTGCWRADRRRG